MPTLTIAPSPQATERTYEWAAKSDVHHWFTADQATQTAKADVHHWFNAAADQSAPAQVELSLN